MRVVNGEKFPYSHVARIRRGDSIRYDVVMSNTNSPKSKLAAEIGKKGAFDAREEVYLNLARSYQVLATHYQQLFKQHSLSSPQYNVLRILRGHGTPVSVYQIGDEMITKQSDMPRLIERLASRQLVSKTRCEHDRRVVWVTLSKTGKALLKKIDKPLSELHGELLGHLSSDQLSMLSDLLCMARNPTDDAAACD